MVKKIILVFVCVLLAAALLAGCNESYKTKAIDTEKSDTVYSNGGLAVGYGKYLYYINGYAGNEADNTFGKVQKGAIARVELDQNGNPILETNKIIVPKNVYNTNAQSGLYIVDDYIYYTTPSIDKDSKGKPKVSEMWLMRTKVDGTDTKVIKKFKSYTPVYKVTKGYILYVLDYELYQIDLSSKKFAEKKVDEKISSQLFTKHDANANGFVDAVFYLKASENQNDFHNVLWCYRAGSESPVKVIEADAATYGSAAADYPTGFQLTLVDAVYMGGNLRLVYNKTDQGTNKTSAGSYYYDFADNLAFNPANEVRLSKKITFTNFWFLDNDTALVNNGSNIEMIKRAASEWGRTSVIPGTSGEAKVFDIRENNNEVVVYYLQGNTIYRISALEKTENGYVDSIKSSSVVFDASYNTSWLTPDLVGNNVYFFNTKALDNVYFVNIVAAVDRDADSRVGRLVGLITAEDEVALLTSGS